MSLATKIPQSPKSPQGPEAPPTLNFDLEKGSDTPTFEAIVLRSLGRMLEYAHSYSGRVFDWLGVYLVIDAEEHGAEKPTITVHHLFKLQGKYYERHQLPTLTNEATQEVIFKPAQESMQLFINDTLGEARAFLEQHRVSHKLTPREVYAEVVPRTATMQATFGYQLTDRYEVNQPLKLAAWRKRLEEGTPELGLALGGVNLAAPLEL